MANVHQANGEARYETFVECKVSLALLGSLVVAFKEVVAPPCYWITYKAIACFYKEESGNALIHHQLASNAIDSWFKFRTIYIIPIALTTSVFGVIGAITSFFVPVKRTSLFSAIVKMDRYFFEKKGPSLDSEVEESSSPQI